MKVPVCSQGPYWAISPSSGSVLFQAVKPPVRHLVTSTSDNVWRHGPSLPLSPVASGAGATSPAEAETWLREGRAGPGSAWLALC